MKKFQEMEDFIHTLCPLPNHWCDGRPIPSQATIKLPPCEYYADCKCFHPQNPRNVRSSQRPARRCNISNERW